MKQDELGELEKLAREATPGPWSWKQDRGGNYDSLRTPTSDLVVFAAPVGYENSSMVIEDKDAAFIAAVNPQTVGRLITRIRALEAALRSIKTDVDKVTILLADSE